MSEDSLNYIELVKLSPVTIWAKMETKRCLFFVFIFAITNFPCMCSNFENTVNNSDYNRQVGKHVVNSSTSVNHNVVHKMVSRNWRGMIFYASKLLIIPGYRSKVIRTRSFKCFRVIIQKVIMKLNWSHGNGMNIGISLRLLLSS